jgi:hypothetical protein
VGPRRAILRICDGLIRPGAEIAIDHIVPVSKGDTHDLSNLQVVHYERNQLKFNKSQEARDRVEELRDEEERLGYLVDVGDMMGWD